MTNLLSERADTLLDLAHVLAAAGQLSDARAATTQALDLYQRKATCQEPGPLRYAANNAPS